MKNFHEIAERVAATMRKPKGAKALTEDQFMLMAGALAVELDLIRAQARAEFRAELKPVAWHVHGRRGKRTYVLIPFDSEAAAKEEAAKLHDATIIPLALIPDTKE